MKKAKKERSGNVKGYIVAGILTAILGVAVWGILVMAERKLLNADDVVKRYAFAKDVAKGTVIEEGMLSDGTFKIVELTSKAVPADCVMDMNEALGKFLVCDAKANALCTESILGDNGKSGNTKTISLAVNGLVKATAGKLRANDKVDVYLIPNDFSAKRMADTDALLEPTYTSVYLDAVYDGNGRVIANDDTTGIATTFSIVVDDKTANEIVSGLALGYTVWLVKTE